MAAWIGTLFASLAGFFAQWFTKKTVTATAAVAGSLALTAAFVAALHGLQNQLSASVPSWVIGLGYFVPDNAALCFSAVVSAKIARWIYDYHMSVLKMAVTA